MIDWTAGEWVSHQPPLGGERVNHAIVPFGFSRWAGHLSLSGYLGLGELPSDHVASCTCSVAVVADLGSSQAQRRMHCQSKAW